MKHAYVDGGLTIQRFLEAGLIDRLILTRIPVLIGKGKPLFGPTSRDIPLRHIETPLMKAAWFKANSNLSGDQVKGAVPRIIAIVILYSLN